MAVDVSVIIVNYNTKEITAQCVESVMTNTRKVSYEIILVDNASTDGSLEIFRKDKRIILVESPVNLGFGRANNLGYRYSKGRYVFLLNSDTILLNDAISEFVAKASLSQENVACLGAYLLGEDRLPNKSYGNYMLPCRVLKNVLQRAFKKKKVHPWGKHQDYMDVEVVLGADMFIKRSFIDNYGLFDESFFMYHEENDLQRRYASKGAKMQLITGPRIVHLENASSSKLFSSEKRKMIDSALFNYMRIWENRSSFYVFKFFYILLKMFSFFDSKYKYRETKDYIHFLIQIKYDNVN